MQELNYPGTWGRRPTDINRRIDEVLATIRERAGGGLHLGAGIMRIEGLINCDPIDPAADRRVDALDLGEFPDNSVPLIETHHMVEHLSFAEVSCALTEWRRVLSPGGYLIITCPDLTQICGRWLKTLVRQRFSRRPEQIEAVLRMLMGSQEHPGMFHKSAYDAGVMRHRLAEARFQVEFQYTPYPLRPTPSLLTIARKM